MSPTTAGDAAPKSHKERVCRLTEKLPLIHTYIHTYIYTYKHEYIIHTYIHTYIHTCIHTYIIHTCIHTYIHTYIHKYIYYHSFGGAFGQGFFFVSATVCDSRNWDSRSNSFVRAPSSGGGSNAPRPAVSVPHLDVNADRRCARQARSAFFFCILGGIRPSYSWILAYAELERINKGQHFKIGIISKLASKLLLDDAFFMAASKRLRYRSYYLLLCVVSFWLSGYSAI